MSSRQTNYLFPSLFIDNWNVCFALFNSLFHIFSSMISFDWKDLLLKDDILERFGSMDNLIDRTVWFLKGGNKSRILLRYRGLKYLWGKICGSKLFSIIRLVTKQEIWMSERSGGKILHKVKIYIEIKLEDANRIWRERGG